MLASSIAPRLLNTNSELASTASETTVRKDAQIAQGKTPTAGVGKGKKKTKGKKGKKGKKK